MSDHAPAGDQSLASGAAPATRPAPDVTEGGAPASSHAESAGVGALGGAAVGAAEDPVGSSPPGAPAPPGHATSAAPPGAGGQTAPPPISAPGTAPGTAKGGSKGKKPSAPAHAAGRAMALDDVFAIRRIEAVWKATVRDALRKQPITDLHDYLDVHRNLRAYASRVRDLVLTGRYRPTPPEVTTAEKAEGVCRRLLLPSATDALVLQVLTDVIRPVLERRQPTKNAYYSRRQKAPRPEQVDGTFGYDWWVLWPAFQRRIWQFAKNCPFVVVTDVANYFDCIPHAPLRNAIAAMGQLDEPVLDLLFFALEAFTWRPYYLPPSGVGIPQMELEAPRLLAHAYLFAADELLARETADHAVRWMDDIDFGVDSVPHARRVLGQLETLLNGYGLRLNSGKTKVLSGAQAVRYFCMHENQRLTWAEQRLDSGMLTPAQVVRVRQFLLKSWRDFKRRRPYGQHEKIRKRYYTVFGKLADPCLDGEVQAALCDAPRVRDAVLGYLRRLGFSPKRFSAVEHFLVRSGTCLDDHSLFAAAQLLITWRVPTGRYPKRIAALAEALPRQPGATTTAFLSGLWLLAKYAPARQLHRYLKEHELVWTRSNWAARQVAAALPRLSRGDQRVWSDRLVQDGLYDGVGVLAHHRQLARLPALDRQLKSYLLHRPKAPYNYELPKTLLAVTLLEGDMPLADRRALQNDLLQLVDDPVYRATLLARIPAVTPPPAPPGAPTSPTTGRRAAPASSAPIRSLAPGGAKTRPLRATDSSEHPDALGAPRS